jgi:hypothetical protein
MSVVLVGGLVLGVVLSFFIYLLRPTFDNPRAVMEVLGRPVLGGVSMIHNQEWSAKHRHALIAYSVAGVGLLLLYGGALTVSGLDINLAGIQEAIVGRG